jgi:hypothetical protein
MRYGVFLRMREAAQTAPENMPGVSRGRDARAAAEDGGAVRSLPGDDRARKGGAGMQSMIAEPEGITSFREMVKYFQRVVLMQALVDAKGNAGAAAEQLGIHRNTFTRILTPTGARPLSELCATLRESGQIPAARPAVAHKLPRQLPPPMESQGCSTKGCNWRPMPGDSSCFTCRQAAWLAKSRRLSL